jgi:hypothetical protein
VYLRVSNTSRNPISHHLIYRNPIYTYGKRRCGNPGLVKWQHCIAYTGREVPGLLPGEDPKEERLGMLSPIRVRSREGDSIHKESRINHAQRYTYTTTRKFTTLEMSPMIPSRTSWRLGNGCIIAMLMEYLHYLYQHEIVLARSKGKRNIPNLLIVQFSIQALISHP